MNLPPRSRISARVLLQEAFAGITQRPGRAALTALGTVIGIAVLVIVLGLTGSASVQVSRESSLVEATEVRVTQEGELGTQIGTLAFPLDAEERAEGIDGVRSATLRWNLVGLVATNPPGARAVTSVVAASPGVFDTVEARFAQGLGFDSGHSGRSARVAVIGTGTARDLGVADLTRQPSLLIGGIRFTVIGIIDDTARMPELLSAVIVPIGTAHGLWHDPAPEAEPMMLLDVAAGAAPVVGPQLPVAMSPTHPDRFAVALPPDPRGLRESVDAQLSGLFLGLAVVCLVVGMIGIANTTIVAVIERTGEIGLRRAMGAEPRHIAAQFLAETAILGVVGGLIGTSLGVVGVVAICAGLAWTPVLSPLLIVAGPAIGLAAGTLAGIYPALRASHLEPVEALRV